MGQTRQYSFHRDQGTTLGGHSLHSQRAGRQVSRIRSAVSKSPVAALTNSRNHKPQGWPLYRIRKGPLSSFAALCYWQRTTTAPSAISPRYAGFLSFFTIRSSFFSPGTI